MTDTRIVEGTAKARGEVHTPHAVARYLNAWAIRSPSDRVLDLGIGHGEFALDAYKQLRNLGASEATALEALYGAERDGDSYTAFAQAAQGSIGGLPPHVHHADFFNLDCSSVEAVVGNPPYVRRNHLDAKQLAAIRHRPQAVGIPVEVISGLSDLFCYFLLYADRFLVIGGRMAVILSSTWLDVGYGRMLKRFLLDRYRLRAIIGVEGQVFGDALVKCVLVLAEKAARAEDRAHNTVRFVRVQDSAFFDRPIESILDGAGGRPDTNLLTVSVPQSMLSAQRPWGTYLKAQSVFEWAIQHSAMASLGEIATTRIGLQTFAKDFYLFTGSRGHALPVEPEYTRPIAFSPREFAHPVISDEAICPSRVLYCREPKSHLTGTRMLPYIEAGERQPVRVRGKVSVVTGYPAVPKVQSARRAPWYDLVTELTRHGCFDILIPRRMYTSYLALWNRAGVAVNEDFIGVRAHTPEHVLPLLAFLNSSLGECLLRLHAQVYGGGVFNLNPGDVPAIPVLDTRAISPCDAQMLTFAFGQFCTAPIAERRQYLDDAVAKVLGLTAERRQEVDVRLADMRAMASGAKVVHALSAHDARETSGNAPKQAGEESRVGQRRRNRLTGSAGDAAPAWTRSPMEQSLWAPDPGDAIEG